MELCEFGQRSFLCLSNNRFELFCVEKKIQYFPAVQKNVASRSSVPKITNIFGFLPDCMIINLQEDEHTTRRFQQFSSVGGFHGDGFLIVLRFVTLPETTLDINILHLI